MAKGMGKSTQAELDWELCGIAEDGVGHGRGKSNDPRAGHGKGKIKGKGGWARKGKGKGNGKSKSAGKGKGKDSWTGKGNSKGTDPSAGKMKAYGQRLDPCVLRANSSSSGEERSGYIEILAFRYGCAQGACLRVVGESKDGRNILAQGGHQVPKSHIGTGWKWTEADLASDESDSDWDSSSNESAVGMGLGFSSGERASPSSDIFDDFDFDFYDDSHLDYLREQYPGADSDHLEDLYLAQVQADAEEYAGYCSDSD